MSLSVESDSLCVPDSLESLLSTVYNLVDLFDPLLVEEDLEIGFAAQYIKDLVVKCPN